MENIETSGSALASGSIASRFISQNAVDEANAIREKEWKDAYERIGEVAPPKMPDAPQDGRTLYERLKEQEELKQDEWDNRMKLSNQYRGLDTEEMAFLSDKIQERRAVERKNEEEDNREVRSYREALAKKNADALLAAEPQLEAKPEPSAPKQRVAPPKPAAKTNIKKLMKGVVIKKKAAKPASSTPTETSDSTATAIQPTAIQPTAIQSTSQAKRPIEDEPLIDKKRKL